MLMKLTPGRTFKVNPIFFSFDFFANSTIFELSRATANDVLPLFDEELILRSEWGHQSFRNIGNISKTKTKIIDFFGIWGHL